MSKGKNKTQEAVGGEGDMLVRNSWVPRPDGDEEGMRNCIYFLGPSAKRIMTDKL